MQWSKIVSSKKQFIHKITLNTLAPNTPYLPHSFIECRNFCSIGSAKWRATNVVCGTETKEQCVRIWSPFEFSSVRSPAYGPNSKPVTRKSAKGTPKSIRRSYYRVGEIRVYLALHSLQTTRNSESNSPRDVCTRWQGVQEARARIACDSKRLQLLQFRNWWRRSETEILATTNLFGAVKWYRNGGVGEHQRGWHGDRFVHWSLSSNHEKLPQALQVSELLLSFPRTLFRILHPLLDDKFFCVRILT
jgi:hypothetical protein